MTEDDSMKGFINRQDLINEANKRAGGWISVKDRLPEAPCIFYWSDKRITVIEVDDGMDKEEIDYCINGNPDFNVTHWMPLPEAPK